jgi:hypothetical protein
MPVGREIMARRYGWSSRIAPGNSYAIRGRRSILTMQFAGETFYGSPANCGTQADDHY